MMRKTALVAGGGGVLGAALCREFSTAGYAVASLRRADSAEAIDASISLRCDFQDPRATKEAIARVATELGEIDVLIYNAAHLVVGPFSALTLDDFEQSWRTCVGGAVLCTHEVLPGMLRRGSGALIFSGATSAIRGAPNFSAFAAAKFALRGWVQSIAREYQSRGIHAIHVVIDGLLRGSPSVQRFGGVDERAIDPVDVARTYRWLAEQYASAWTQEIDLRPMSEKF